jgi:GAF domain-containing protein
MADAPNSAAARLEARVKELEQERKHLLAVIEILEEISGTLHFVDILQAITRKLGEAFGLDRCSIFLAERGGRRARLVASYEDPSIRNYVVDLERYPELKRALASGETVFIPDAQADPNLKHVKGSLANRKVRSITVVPITWRGVAIGAIFLRTFREGPAFSEADIRFTQVVGSLAAKALRNAFRYEKLLQREAEVEASKTGATPNRSAELERVALIGFLKRLLDAYQQRDGTGAALLARSSVEELDRLVEIAMAVLAEEGKGR